MGNVSKGNEACYACDGQGEAETPDRTVCMSCGAGQAPAVNRSQCVSCVGNDYSTFGIGCTECPLGLQPNNGNVVCIDVRRPTCFRLSVLCRFDP